MIERKFLAVLFIVMFFAMAGCGAFKQPTMQVDPGSVLPGTIVTRGGRETGLLGTPIATGMKMVSTDLIDAMTLEEVDLSKIPGKVLFLSIVPSIDTKVCEAQTHLLGEEGDSTGAEILRITISRDTPFAQKRFAEDAKLTNIQYLSDYKEGAFGRSIGLLMDGPMLLARAVILVDRKGIVRYVQVVPEVSHLPDMEKAFAKSQELVQEY